MSVLGRQTPVLRDGFGDLIHVNVPNVAQCFNIVDMASDDLQVELMYTFSMTRAKRTLIHKDARVGNRLSSKLTTVRLSAGALRFLDGAGFLNGSTPESLAHLWQRKPGPGLAAIVYFV